MQKSRLGISTGAIVLAIGLLAMQLIRLQIINQDEAHEVSRGNALRTLRVSPARGAIYDRNGVLMVYNEPTYTVTLTPRYFDPSGTELLARLLDLPDSTVAAKLSAARGWSSYRPTRAFPDVPFARYSRIQENSFKLPGVGKEVGQKRRYFTKVRAAHALGYVGEITQSELDSDDFGAEYRPGDLLGRTGVERAYESHLRGIPGSALKVVNVYGMEVKSYIDGQEDKAPLSGYDIHLAMDLGVQALAESLFVGKRGAAVALDVSTGGIIALVSMPDFEPAIFSRTLELDAWRQLSDNPDKPLYNRATMNRMPPGSTWKPLMALMALSEGLITTDGANGVVFCPGYHPVGNGRIFRCPGVHGQQTVLQAIKNSCNTFFFEMARRMDVTTFKRYANMFGFGLRAPTDIREQTPGLIPDSSFFNATYTQWGIGTTMNLGIGQGDMGVTPLQLARYAATVANGGLLHAPRLVTYLENAETGHRIEPPGLPGPERIPINEDYFELVREGMRLVMEQGSGSLAQIPSIASGGKTGTAQAPGAMPDHSVFIMFAPFEDPQIAVAVQCENAGSGSECAAPIASLLAERFLKGELPSSAGMRFRMERALRAFSAPYPEKVSDSNRVE